MQSNVVNKAKFEEVATEIDVNFRGLVAAASADERAAVANDIMNNIFSGTLCWDIVDRVAGSEVFGDIDTDEVLIWILPVRDYVIGAPPLWWISQEQALRNAGVTKI